MTVIAKQFGFTNGAGAIANLVDGNALTFWSPLVTDFSAYPDQFFLTDKVTLNYGKSFPALEFDMGEAKRVPQMYLKVETGLTLGPAILIGSDTGATSPADTLQTGDVLLAEYTAAEITSNRFLDVPTMRDGDIRKRFLRLLQRSNAVDDTAPTPGPLNSATYDTGSGDWEIPDYSSQLTIELWGGGSSGGVTGEANNGAATTATRGAWGITLTANGGTKASAVAPNTGTGAGTGGTASNGNTANTTGQNGSTPSPTSALNGTSGKGGDSPNGGAGGAAVFLPLVIGGAMFKFGEPGQAPGGAGSGRSYWYPSGDALFQKFPGGGAGGYCKHVLERTSGLADPGAFISWLVGDGGISTGGDGKGAQGRVRFSWT